MFMCVGERERKESVCPMGAVTAVKRKKKLIRTNDLGFLKG